MQAKKSLGQHWLKDQQTLEAIAEYGEIKKTDTVLEVGPGLGTLTQYLTRQASHVVAVEVDEKLATKLSTIAPSNLSIVRGDILEFDLNSLPEAYKVVANIPYYLTNKLVRTFAESVNSPRLMVLLVQKEVAQRLCASPGQMSLLSVSAQLYYQVLPGIVVSAEKFEPPPKVDSQVVVFRKHNKPLFDELDSNLFFRIVKAGFSAKRKKLRSSLGGGLSLTKQQTANMLNLAGVSPDLRAQNLSLRDWYDLYQAWKAMI